MFVYYNIFYDNNILYNKLDNGWHRAVSMNQQHSQIGYYDQCTPRAA